MPTPPRTSVADIVAAGRDILEADGLPGLTMQAVAARVGVRAPSLYKHVKDRDSLVGLVADDTVRDLRERLERVGRRARRIRARVPGIREGVARRRTS